jgi:sugar transferase EpsL
MRWVATSRAKRALDVAGAAIGMVVAGPVLLVLAACVRLTMGSPVFFRQPRLGQFGTTFEIIKLRSMRPPIEGEDQFLTDADRVTGLGRFLRRTSLDELPELLLVVSGKMSLVGPRPLLPVYQELMDDRQRLRLVARPGLTGLAQVSGRQDLRLSERLELDARYVETWSFWQDLAILLETLVSVFRATGVKTGQTLSDIDDIGLQARLAEEPERDESEGEAG